MVKSLKNILFFVLVFSIALFFAMECSDGKGDLQSISAANVAANEVEPPDVSGDDNKEVSQNAISTSRQNAITRAVADVSPKVVGINVTQIREYRRRDSIVGDPFFRQFFPELHYHELVKGLGSGFIISPDGYIITNQHVVENATEILVTLSGGKEYKAQVVGDDFTSDIALLKINGSGLPSVDLGNSAEIIIGEWVIALGNPFGLFDVNSRPTVTVGVVSATDQDFGRQSNDRVYEDMIQTDAAINGGNSGGPLVNSLGEVIGVNTWIISGSESMSANIGLGFAIPINRVKRILDDLKKYGRVDRSFWTGIHYDELTPSIARFLGLGSQSGVLVSDIDNKSPAERAGLKVGDIITEINGEEISDFRGVKSVIDDLDLKPGDIMEFKVYRKNRFYTINVVLEKHPRSR